MTVADVPIGDTVYVRPKVLIISENGGMTSDAINLVGVADVIYFQRAMEDVPHILSDLDGMKRATSWRPYVTQADMIIVDDPSFVAKLGKDFNLDDTVVLYRINNESYLEAARLMHWLNPATIDTLKAAMENVDIELEPTVVAGPPIARFGRIRRLFSRRSRA